MGSHLKRIAQVCSHSGDTILEFGSNVLLILSKLASR
jgi:hypothetical protein